MIQFQIMETLGWLGSWLLALCAIPAAYKCWYDGHARGLSSTSLIMWFAGEVMTLLYVLPKQDFPLMLNYASNIALLLVIFYYKLWPRDNELPQRPERNLGKENAG